MKFYLGAPEAIWLSRTEVPLFVSHTRLRRIGKLKRALAPWALDSGGFSEISKHGRWTVTAATYAAAVTMYSTVVGKLEWAAPLDV